jgi:AsmA-like C-terminal region
MTAKGTGDRLEATLESTGFAEGRVNARVQLSRQKGHQELSWSGKGQGLHVDTIMQVIEPGREARLKGTGSFSMSGTGLLNEDPFRKHLKGTMDLTIADGQFLHAPFFKFLSTYTHVKELEHMGFDELRSNLRLDNQGLYVDSITVIGPLANLNGNMSFPPDNTVDGRIFVKVGPSIGEKIKIPCMSALLKTPDGFTALPFAVRITGPTEQPAFSADTAAWNYVTGGLASLADPMKALLQGCREDRAQ